MSNPDDTMKSEASALSFKPSPNVPLFTDLVEVYPDSPGVGERFKQIAAAFEKAYGGAPEIYTRAPGRVNLIGEHIDYEGYGVLPMAIRQDTVVAIRRCSPGSPDRLHVANVECDKYPLVEFSTDPHQVVDVGRHSWANYFLSAYKGAFELLTASRPEAVPEPCGLQAVVHGLVPTGSGLSSSAAIVCSCMLAVLVALGVQPDSLDKAQVAEAACKAERYVGVTSGGMDQAISMMGQQGVAMHVEFNPVRGVCLVLPPGATFVIAHSLAVSNKAETAPRHYNLRVVECRLAATLLAMGLGLGREEALAKIHTLRDVEPLIAAKYGNSDSDTAVLAATELLEDVYNGPALVSMLLGGDATSLSGLFSGEPGSLRAVAVAEAEQYCWPLRHRAVHVYGEAKRVLDFRAVCEDASLPVAERLTRLGVLMNESHTSCAQEYGCSCPELEELVAVAREAGALGARLTGAGWGGCTVSLVRDEQVEDFLTAVRMKYYQPRVDRGDLSLDALPEVLFATKPSSGAALLKLATVGEQIGQEGEEEVGEGATV